MSEPIPEEGIELHELGRADDLRSLPRRVDLGTASYFLVRAGAELRLLSRVCPHKGGIVEDAGTKFECPRHGWQFDRETGRCLTGPTQSLASYEVVEREGILYAALPHGTETRERERAARTAPLTFQLHAHACLEIRHEGFSLLTDPWLEGPAFYGAWLHYPAPRVDVRKLRPDAIWISHEHSDHFHAPTLELLSKDTPVYVPDFPNQRLPRLLASLGFTDVHALPFGESVGIGGGMRLTCFEPASLWNDAILLVEAGGFRYLNLNDAGVNHHIARLVHPVDLISSTFSPGASGYPLTWTHLDADEKLSIFERSRQGSLDMLRDAASIYGAHFVLPFASFFTLGHPEHRHYLSMFRKNAPTDVVAAFADTDVDVLDLLPGEVWNAANGKRTTLPFEHREQLFDTTRMLRYAEEHWDDRSFEAAYPHAEGLALSELESYFLRLNEVPEMAFCEDLTCVVRGLDPRGRALVEVAFEVDDGVLSLASRAPAEPNVTIQLPAAILERIVAEDVSWDEAFIGYWCTLTRSPNVYHAGFWRLLQAPYYGRPAGASTAGEPLSADAPIAAVLETYGEPADRILRRYGLYCLGCQHSPFETIRHGARKHGLTELELGRVVAELREALGAEADARTVPA